MQMIFRRKWEGAHRFIAGENRESKCSQPHGHTWHVEAVVEANDLKINLFTNTLVPFEVVKGKWHEFIDNHIDHSFIYNSEDPLLDFMLKDNPAGRHVVTPGDPTTEILSIIFKAKLNAFLKELHLGLQCKSIQIDETQTNSIRFDGIPEVYLPSSANAQDFWWNRPDFSTNDLSQNRL